MKKHINLWPLNVNELIDFIKLVRVYVLCEIIRFDVLAFLYTLSLEQSQTQHTDGERERKRGTYAHQQTRSLVLPHLLILSSSFLWLLQRNPKLQMNGRENREKRQKLQFVHQCNPNNRFSCRLTDSVARQLFDPFVVNSVFYYNSTHTAHATIGSQCNNDFG